MTNPGTGLTIPRDWDGFTPDWMTTALAGRHPGAVVSKVDVVEVEEGTHHRARLRLGYASGEGPETVFIKAPPQLGHRLIMRASGTGNEARFYNSNESFPIEMPCAYANVSNGTGFKELVVLEDIATRGGTPNYAREPLTVEAVGRGLDGLARLHAQYWGFAKSARPNLAWLPSWKARRGIAVITALGSWVGLRRKRDPISLDVMPSQLRDWRRLSHLCSEAVRSSFSGEPTILHGDAHVGNTYRLPGDNVGFYDWQCASIGGWEQDAGYFMVSALDVADRRAHERDLLERYLASLRSEGIESPTTKPDEAWLRYRKTPAYGLAIWLATVGLRKFQHEDNGIETTRRFATAFLDLDTDKALSRS